MQQVPGIIKDREAIGEKLRQVREAQGLTQDALAMRLGTDRKVDILPIVKPIETAYR